MDDIDGALFSRVPVKGSESSLDRLIDQSALPVSHGCGNEGKYSKLEYSNGTSQLKERQNKSGHNGETLIKREKVPVFHSVPPKYKDTKRQIKSKSKTPEMSSRVSAPCNLNTEYENEPLVINSRQSSSGVITPVAKRALFNRMAHTQNDLPEQFHVGESESDNEKISVQDLPGNGKSENNTGVKSREKILHRKIVSSSSSSTSSSSSFGDVDSNWDIEPLVDEQKPDIVLRNSNQTKESDTESVSVPEKMLPKKKFKSIESVDIPSRVSFVSYLTDDGIIIDANGHNIENDVVTLNIKPENDQNGKVSTTNLNDITLKDGGTDTTDARIKQCAENETTAAGTKSGILNNVRSSTEHLENFTMLNNNERTKRKKPVACRIIMGLAFPLLSLIIYIWDIGSDIRLAIAYKEQGDINLFWITMACIVIPIILMSIVDVSWLWLDRPPKKMSHIVRCILGVFTLGRIVRSVIYMWHIIKSKLLDKEEGKLWHKKRATEEKRDCYMLDFINAFAESVPQLFVQVYLMYAFDLELTKIRTLNLLSSWASIAWTYSAYYRCNREVMAGKQDLKILGFAVFFMSVLSALAARVICVVLFLIYFKTWIGVIVLAVHFICMLLWIVCKEKPTLEGTTSSKFGKYMYCIFFAYVSLLCFLNLRNTRARFRMAAFYLLIYIENFTLAALSFYKMYTSQVVKDKLYNLLALPVGFVLHLFLLVLYYQLFHPKTGRYR